ncbi:MAG: WGR domain-containing protein, partial [Inhella sp.]
MRRFELIEGSSSKFWEVDLSGTELTVRFGRIGTAGQSKTKAFDDAAAALKELNKLVKEKTGKGYAEVRVAADAKLGPAPAPAAAPAPQPPPAPAPMAAPVAPAALTPPATPADIPWPQGGFLWTPALRERLPVLRSLHMPDESALWRSLQLDWSQEAGLQYRAHRFQEAMQAAGRSWTFWAAAQMQAAMQPERLQQADIEAWSERLAQAGQHFASVRSPDLPRDQTWHAGVAWTTEQGLHLHGLNFMLEVGLDLLAVMGKAYEVLRCFQLLRARIARADEAEHQAAIELLEREAGHSPLQREMRAFLCPHRADWVQQALADPPQDGSDWLRECVMPPQDALAYLRRSYQSYDNMVGPLLLHTHMHGAAALPLFAQAVNLAANKEEAEKLLNLMLRLHVPELLPALVGLMNRLEARNALDKLAEEFPAATLLCLLQARSEEAAAAALRLALRLPAALQAVRAAVEGNAQLAAL